MINQLAKSLQYLPHVQEVDFKRLRAPKKDIKALMISLRQLRYLLRWIRRFQRRRKHNESLILEQRGVAHKRGKGFFALLERQHNSSLLDWKDAFALLRNGTSIPVQEPPTAAAPAALTWTSQKQQEELAVSRVYDFLGLFSIAYKIDLGSASGWVARYFGNPTTEQGEPSQDGDGYRFQPPSGYLTQQSHYDLNLPSMVSVVDQAREHATSQISGWDVFTWAAIAFGLAYLCKVTRE